MTGIKYYANGIESFHGVDNPDPRRSHLTGTRNIETSGVAGEWGQHDLIRERHAPDRVEGDTSAKFTIGLSVRSFNPPGFTVAVSGIAHGDLAPHTLRMINLEKFRETDVRIRIK